MFEELSQNVRYGVRAQARNPGFASLRGSLQHSARLRRSRPAPASSISERATSATTG
jgi:hypothetical protein